MPNWIKIDEDYYFSYERYSTHTVILYKGNNKKDMQSLRDAIIESNDYSYVDAINENPGSAQYYECQLCKQPVYAHFSKETQDKMESKGLCFTCNHWDEVSKAQYMDAIKIIIGKNHFTVHPWEDKSKLDYTQRRFMGHGGRDMYIQWENSQGEQKFLHSNNVWCQGVIPDLWVKRLTTRYRTGKFITKEEYDLGIEKKNSIQD